MRPYLWLLLSFSVSHQLLIAQEMPPLVEAQSGQVVSVNAELSEGIPMPDLSWAWNSSNACFVEPRKDKFTGNHYLLKTEIPRYSTMLIRVIPEDRGEELSLYAYSGGWGELPPALPSCVSCEADFEQERASVHGRNRPAHVREVELRAVNRPYPVTIGVVGANGRTSGAFRVEIEVIPR